MGAVLKLNLGVIDLPHSESKDGLTTGDLAQILEAKYHPLEIFAELHKQELADDLADSVSGAIESLMMGAPPSLNPFGEGEAAITARIKDFFTNAEMDNLGYPGVPTKAALDGVSHRFKRKRGPRRPSFVDTSQYMNSTTAWVE